MTKATRVARAKTKEAESDETVVALCEATEATMQHKMAANAKTKSLLIFAEGQ